ncbi:MAG: cupin domain-containing protein [Candidatus Planktophila sp.]|jgi:mannose-6-phosphate isomerase-like protein (cupin superfamily)|tara:strand:+ start:868 stop:1296 length:429 start_codon:yes stop_codon:yes gene_type:complete
MKPDPTDLDRFVTNLNKIPIVEGLKRDEGWVNMKVQFLIDKMNANSKDLLVGWTVLPPGAMHDKHRHFHADEFWIVISGSGVMYTDDGEEPANTGDVVLTPRGKWHGFKNTTQQDVVLVWGWSGAGSLEDAGYEVSEETHFD